jgi:opacity protein-like surface antigen
MEPLKRLLLLAASMYLLVSQSLYGQDTNTPGLDSMEIYGFVQADAGYNFNQINPNWFDVVRPSKLPSVTNQFGASGNTYFSVRQTRFGVKNYFRTPLGQLKTIFEFEMFGTGVDTGQTTLRLRHAYGELGKFGAGQYWSPFMDIDIFPNSLEYWGPNGMAFFRNVQIRYMPIQGKTRLTIALERPGASADQGVYGQRIELKGVNARFPLPDLSAEYRQATGFGYIELAGILRKINWKDQNGDSLNLTGGTVGWGLNLSTNVNLGKSNLFKGQVVYGQGIENYMNDAPEDVAIRNNFSNPAKPIKGVPLPILGIVAFLDHTWSKRFTSSIGYSHVQIYNTSGQSNSAFRQGQYALVNLLYYPTDNVMAGIEYQWGRRQNFRDGFEYSISKVQVSLKYKFSGFIRNR